MRMPLWIERMSRGRLIGLGAGTVAGALLIGTGVWMATRPSPPGLPTTAQEAAAVLASGRLDLLDDARREQFMAETHRLMQGLTEEERRAIFEDEQLRQALRDARRDAMDERIREFARTGEMPEFPGGRRGPGGPGGEAVRERFENMTEEEREQFREERRREMVDQVAQDTSSGNAQSTGLQQEMMKRMQKQREQNGGGARRGGG